MEENFGRIMEQELQPYRDELVISIKAGYGEYFTHRTGHGIGIDTHEEPCAASGDKSVIEPGLAFSVEPGIYLPGKFGIRIEDQIFLTADGAKVLHDYPRNEWLVCG